MTELLVNIDVDDLEKAVAFYGDAFGLTVGRRFGALGVELLGASSPLYLLVKSPGDPGLTYDGSEALLWPALDSGASRHRRDRHRYCGGTSRADRCGL